MTTTLGPSFVITSNNLETVKFTGLLKDMSKGGILVNRISTNVMNVRDVEASFTKDASRMFSIPNAGGSSLYSEVLSLEILKALFGVKLLRTEMEIAYALDSKITDYSALIGNRVIGVSVTRAINFEELHNINRRKAILIKYHPDQACDLLNKKLNGIIHSSEGVCDEHKWEKQILHVMTTSEELAKDLVFAYENKVGPENKANTVVMVTVCPNMNWIFV